MKYILSVLFLFFFFSGFTQIYQEMPQYGYRANRMAFDSTLQIPTVCGVPTLKSVVSVNRKAAIAFDSCNNKFYTYNPKTLTWSEVSGGGNPTFQNVIDNGNLITKNDTIKFNEQTKLNFTGKASGNQTYSLLDIYNGNTGGIIDMKQFSNPLQQIFFSPNFTYLNNDDISISTSTGLNIINGDINMSNDNKINFLNTSGTYYNSLISDANNDGSDKLHHLPNLYQVYDDTLATTFDIRNSTIDTTNRFVNDVTRKNDSTITIYKGASATDITITSVSNAKRLTTNVYNASGSTIAKGSVVYINGRHSSNLPTILKAQANDENNSYKTFAIAENDIADNSAGVVIQAGNITNLNLPTSSYTDGDIVYLSPTIAGGITITKPLAPFHICKIGSVTRAHPTLGSIEIKIENGWQLDELSDVQIPAVPNDSTLLQFSRVDSLWHSVSVNNAIGTKYIKPSDTATMLTPYLRSNTASATYLAKSDSATYYTKYRSDTSRTNIYNAINGKQAAGTYVTSVSGTSPISSSGGTTPAISISQASTSTNGYLSSTDWNTFNGKIGASDTSVFLRKTDSATYYTKYRSDTSRTNIYNALNGKQGTITLTTTGTSGASTLVGNTLNIPQYSGGTSYTFSTGLTNTSGTITNNLSTGVSGGQSVVGGTAASNSLTLSSTSNATKGKILFGTSAYDEVNNRLGIGTASPATDFHVSYSNNAYGQGAIIQNTNTGTTAITGLMLRNSAGTDVGQFSFYPSNYIVSAQANSVSFGSIGQQKLSFGANTSANGAAAQDIIFSTLGTNSTYQMQIKGNGNVQINTNTDAGYRLDVNGNTRITGTITATDAITSQNYLSSLGYVISSSFGSFGSSTSYGYRFINGGTSQSNSRLSVHASSTIAAGTKGLFADFTQNGLTFVAGTGPNVYIARAGIDIVNLNNTVGSESGDLAFYTQSGGTAMSEKMRITGAGGLTINATNTAAGTTGNQTINKASGTVNIAAAGTTVTVTNNLVTASSIVFAVIRTNDATATIKNVVPAAGSFTINLNSAATAETSIGFFVIN